MNVITTVLILMEAFIVLVWMDMNCNQIITLVKVMIALTYVSYSMVVLYSKDRYEIIGLGKISHSIKQPCGSICLKRVSNASKLLKNAVPWLNKAENQTFRSTTSF